MSRRRKILIAAPLLLLVLAGAAYKLVLAPAPAAGHAKIDGTLYPLASDFTINLADGHYAKVSVALLLGSAPAASADGAATLPQEAAVRAIVTDTLTGLAPADLIERAARHRVVVRLERALKAGTDEDIRRVLLTDVAVE